MISSFFGKTKPINYVVLLVFAGLFYWGLQFFWNRQLFSTENIWIGILAMAVLLLSIFLINELVQQNKVTSLNSFAMLFFVVLTVVFPRTLLDNNAIFSNFFILLATKKLLEVKEAKNVKHKIFDATLLICIASLFYKSAFVFFIAIAFVINTYQSKNFKIWLVFLIGIATFLLLAVMVLIPFNNMQYLSSHYDFSMIDFDGKNLLKKMSLKHITFLVLILLFAIIDFVKLRKKGGGRLVMMRSMLLTYILVFIIIVLESKEASPVLLALFPAAVFLTNFIETIRKARLKELALNLFIISTFLVFAIENLG